MHAQIGVFLPNPKYLMANKEKISPALFAAILATGLMTFSGVVSETAMNVTFPTLMREFVIDTSTVQWLTTAYLLVLALIIPLSTWLNKNFATKALFITANLIFIAGTLFGAFASGFVPLLTGRILQGAGTGIALPLMFNIILTQAPKTRIGFIMGMASLIVAMAPAVGPVLAGVVIDRYGWRTIFLILLPLMGVSLILGLSSIKPIRPLTPEKINLPDYALLVTTFSSFVFATEKASAHGWFSGTVGGLLALAATTLGIFTIRSLRGNAPLVNLRVFTNPVFVQGMLFVLLIQFCVLALGYLIPNYAQLANGTSATLSGLLLLPGCLLGACIAPVSGTVYDRLGARKPILSGALILLATLTAFAILGKILTTALFMGIYTAYCLGQGFAVGNTTTHSLAALPREQSADGNAVLNTLQQLAGTVGTSVAASLVASAQRANPSQLAIATRDGSQHAFILLAVLAFIALISVGRALRQTR